jgi:hypothetical protein
MSCYGTRAGWLATLDECEAVQVDDRERIHEVLFHLCQAHVMAYRYGKAEIVRPLTVVAVNQAGGARDLCVRIRGAAGLVVKGVGPSGSEEAWGEEAEEWLEDHPVLWCEGGRELAEAWRERRRLAEL